MNIALFRFEDGPGGPRCTTWYPIRETRCYQCLLGPHGKVRRVSKTRRYPFALPTIHEALEAFFHRKERQISYLSARLEAARYQRAAAHSQLVSMGVR